MTGPLDERIRRYKRCRAIMAKAMDQMLREADENPEVSYANKPKEDNIKPTV